MPVFGRVARMRELKYRPDHVDSDIRVSLSAVLCNDTVNVAL